jgi:hypothetical protein
MRRLKKFLHLSWQEKQLFCEAVGLVLLSQLAVKAIAFKHIHRFLNARCNQQPQDAFESLTDIRLVRASLSRAVNQLPWSARCLSQSIAAFIMLRRRGIPAVLLVGAKFEDSSLLAHAWIDADRWSSEIIAEKAGFVTLMRIGKESPSGIAH